MAKSNIEINFSFIFAFDGLGKIWTAISRYYNSLACPPGGLVRLNPKLLEKL